MGYVSKMPPQEHTEKAKEKPVSPNRVEPRVIKPYDGDIVISGISGRYPESDSVTEFKDNLLNKVNMVTIDNRRWEPGYVDAAPQMAKLKKIDKFDNDFFGLHSKSAETMDPQLRILLEVVYEAVVDAGESLASMKDTRTGVYIGVTWSDAEHAWMGRTNSYVLTGVSHSIFPNRVSFFLDLRGPSCAYDTACSTSIVVMEAAQLHMRSGAIDQAIVGAVNLCLKPATSRTFVSMNMLGSGACRAFDAGGDGFVRAETVSACLVKKAADAKRIYCTVEAILSNNDGWSGEGLTYPNSYAQEELMRDLYTNAKIDPGEVKYFECHGTGTPAGDPSEARAICSVVCENKKDPLLIGSTKTNMGHGEIASGFASLTKVLIAMHTRLIPPNLHFEAPHPEIPGLFDGRLKVVTEPTPWEGGRVSLNSFGMGGTNAHVVLKSYDEKKSEAHPAEEKPRLFVYSGRTEEGLQNILEEAHKNASNVEFHALCQQSANAPLGSMPFRGATLLNAEKDYTEIQKVQSKPREIWFVYSGMGSQWVGMGRCLMALDIFRESIQECSDALIPFGVDLMDLIMNGTEDKLKTIVAPFVCISAVQVALTDVLFSLGIKPDGLVGHSLGEGSCGYADGCLTRGETVLSAYFRGQCVVESDVAPGKMAAVGLSWEEAQAQCPPGIVPACHNAADSVTISGGADEMTKFMEDLSARGVFAKEVNSSNISYHSHFMEPVAVRYKAALEKHIKTNKPRSNKWVSTSVPEQLWDSPVAKYAKGDYYSKNLESPVLFYEALQKVPKNAIVIEVAPIGLLQSVIKRSVGLDCVSISLQKRLSTNNLEFFLTALGKCFSNGVTMNPLKMYPPVEFPVSRDTPLISSLVAQAWDHSADWPVPKPEDFELGSGSSSADTSYEIDISEDSPDEYLADHKVDGRALFPACGCLYLAWKTLASMKGVDFQKMPVRLSGVRIHQAMFLPPSGSTTVTVSVMPMTGEFQVRENNNFLASGVVESPQGMCLETDQHLQTKSVLKDKSVTEVLNCAEVYRELITRGYEYGHYFQGVQRSSVEGLDADILWDGRWISYLDAVLQMILLGNPDASQALPVMLETVNIDPTVHPAPPETEIEADTLPGHYDKVLGVVAAGGVEIRGVHTIRVSRRLTHNPPVIAEFAFQPFKDVQDGDRTAPYVPQILKDYADACLELSRQVTKRWLEQDEYNLMPNRESLEKCLNYHKETIKNGHASQSYTEVNTFLESILKQKNGDLIPDHGLHSLLNMAYSEPYDRDFLARLRPKVHDTRFEVWDDPVMGSLENDHFIKMCLDLVADNVNANVIDILEAGAIKSAFFRKAIPSALAHFVIKDYRYHAADKLIVEDAITFPVKMLMFDTNDPSSFPEVHKEAYDLVILKNHLHTQRDLDLAFTAYSQMVKPGGFILVGEHVERQPILYPIFSLVCPWVNECKGGPEGERMLGFYYTDAQWRAFFERHGFEEIIHRADGVFNAFFLLRKRVEVVTPPHILHVDDLQCSWLEEVQARFLELKDEPEDARLWLVATSENAGMWGFIKSLRCEPGAEKLRCVHVSNRNPESSMPRLTVDSPDFNEIIKKDIVNNVFRDGRWGTYTVMMISEDEQVAERPMDHVFADCYTPNDLLSLKWFDSPHNLCHQNGKLSPSQVNTTDMDTYCVYYSGVNHRDVLLANGTIKKDNPLEGLFHMEGTLGVEFSGRDSSGRRVMGLCNPPALASTVRCPRSSVWTVPDHWTLEEAASVPMAYVTAYYALVTRARLRKGETVFVQSGWTPVGQALIAIALSKGCEVFTLTRNKEDVALLTTSYRQLKDSNIYNFEDLSFERRILVETGRKGVDVVLNSNNDSALKVQLALLGKDGRFLDISLEADNRARKAFSIGAWKTSTFHTVQLDSALARHDGEEWAELAALLQAGIHNGVVKPLKTQVFTMQKLAEAFKAADGDTSLKKVLIQIRSEERQKMTQTQKTSFPSVYRTWLDHDKTYVIVGGLGGLGLELSDWMVRRGVRKLVLTSRSGVTNGYQTKKVSYLRNFGCEVVVLPISVNSAETAKILVKAAIQLGPIGGIFNMGMVLNDKPFVEHTVESFLSATEVKIKVTNLLDQVSRQEPVRSSLDHFVVFSSITGNHGHQGQSNYSYGNSAAERICEKRKVDGLPGLAIQWGAVGDVGYVGQKANSVVICGSNPQRLPSVKSAFDFMLSQTAPSVMTSYVAADRSTYLDTGEETMVERIVRMTGNILGVKNLANVDGDKDFVDLGLDSLMNVEIKQVLERNLKLVLTNKEIQMMTFNSLRNLIEG